MNLPAYLSPVLQQLEDRGHEVWLVGGCVRDLLRGQTPHDYDLTTSALPEEVCAAFAGQRLVTTGQRHGTIGVVLPEGVVEITTYRTDGAYSDGRHPDGVTFTPNLTEDLARRDFTVNAMAWHPARGLADPFGGAPDLQEGILRCVGNPAARFAEDALRVLRCARFAAQLGFAIEPATLAAGREASGNLQGVSAERVTEELQKLLLAPQPVLGLQSGLLEGILPLRPHPMHARMRVLPPDLAMRLAVLLLTLPGKEDCSYSELMAEADAFFARLRFGKQVSAEATALLDGLFLRLPRTLPEARQILRDTPLPLLQKILGLKTVLWGPQPIELLEQVLKNGDCYSLRQLAVDGSMLPCSGPLVGEVLDWLLAQVIEGTLPNEREALLHAAERYLTTQTDRSGDGETPPKTTGGDRE